MARDEALVDRLLDGRGVIHVAQLVVAGARIKGARLEAGRGQFKEAVMHAQGHRIGSRRHAGDKVANVLAGECDGGLELGVFRECFGARHVDRAAGGVEAEGALVLLTQASSNVHGVAHDETGDIDQRLAFFFGFNSKAGDDAAGKAVSYGLALGGVA